MKLSLSVIMIIAFTAMKSNAQNFEYGKIIGSDVNPKNKIIDSNVNAVVIREYGEATVKYHAEAINSVKNSRPYIDFKYHVKIKILNKNGFKKGEIVIPRKTYNELEEEVLEVVATTYNYENGNLKRTDLDKNQIFHEKINKYDALTKFTMPELKEGSIIEFQYRMIIPDFRNLKTWEFQSDIPKLYSEYITYIPAIYNYNTSLRGYKKLDVSKAEIWTGCFKISSTTYDCSKMTYAMKDIPAFAEEEFMTAAGNFKSAVYSELADYYDPYSDRKKILTKSWPDADKELIGHDLFGRQIKEKGIFEKLIPGITGNITDSMGKACAVYDYIRKNIKPNGFMGIYSEHGIKKALELHSGNTADINLALINALKAAGLDAETIVLSTRSNGTPNGLYPVLTDFNYVVAKLNIGDDSYLMDASQPYLPIGLLPFHCMNGRGRTINLTRDSYWFPIKASEKESLIYDLKGELTEDGKFKGKLIVTSMGYAAVKKRELINRAGSISKYTDKFADQSGINVLKHSVRNADSTENLLEEEYEIELKTFDNLKPDQFVLNPFFMERLINNPFNHGERTFPVDLGTSKEIRISARIGMPDNFKVAEKPANLSMSLENKGGKYVFEAQEEGKTLTYNQIFQLNKATYTPEEYLALKELYNRIILLQKTDLLLKKTL